MGSFSLTHWLVVLAIVLIVFGTGRPPRTVGKLARGMGAFRSEMRDDAASAASSEALIEAQPSRAAGER